MAAEIKKHNRKAELIACCEGIIRNAEKITEELEYNQGLEVKIVLKVHEAPYVEIIRDMFPKEVVDVWVKKEGENE